MERIHLIATEPLDNGTWLRLRNGQWANVDLRLVPLHLIDECTLAFHDLAAFRPIVVPGTPPFYMAFPRCIQDCGPIWRGRLLARADGGSTERWGNPDVMHGGLPWVFLRNSGARSRFPWLQGLNQGRVAFFTPDGRDMREICTPPRRDRDGVLLFDVVGEIRVGVAA